MIPMRTATDLAGAIRRKELSSEEALDAFLGRVGELNSSLNAVVSVDADRARAAASHADRVLASGVPVGPLHGVPMTVKDAIDVAGLRTTIGTQALDRIADTDSVVAERLRAAGAIIAGHTNVPPFLADYQTANSLFGRTANPWDLARTPGGSSGGAGAAVAAGLSPIDIGSDLAGSLRLPAAFCGVYGLKATEHRVPLTGFFRPPPGTPTSVRIMAALGPVARSLEDVELALTVVAGPHADEPHVPPVTLGNRATVDLVGTRLSVVEALPGVRVATDVRDTIARVRGRAADAGAAVIDHLPDIDWDGSNSLFGELLDVLTAIFVPGNGLRDEQRSLTWYLRALTARDRAIATWERFFTDVDALVVPASLAPAFQHAEPNATIPIGPAQVSYLAHGALLVFANYAGLPALTVPGGLGAEGLPIGVQIVGPRWSELRLIAIAKALEDARVLPGFTAPPLDWSRGDVVRTTTS